MKEKSRIFQQFGDVVTIKKLLPLFFCYHDFWNHIYECNFNTFVVKENYGWTYSQVWK